MVAIALLLLALSAGTFLLMKASREYLGMLFKFLSWLIIVISLLSIVFVSLKGARHMHHMREMHQHMGCMNDGYDREEHIVIKEMGDGHCNMEGSSGMSCCKMQGDSMVMDKGMCEKMIGKEACEKMCKERGQCIMSKEECAKICKGNGSCCESGAEPGGMKDCCKKK